MSFFIMCIFAIKKSKKMFKLCTKNDENNIIESKRDYLKEYEERKQYIENLKKRIKTQKQIAFGTKSERFSDFNMIKKLDVSPTRYNLKGLNKKCKISSFINPPFNTTAPRFDDRFSGSFKQLNARFYDIKHFLEIKCGGDKHVVNRAPFMSTQARCLILPKTFPHNKRHEFN